MYKMNQMPESNIVHKEIDGGIEIVRYIGKEYLVDIPETIDGLTVIGIGNGAFSECCSIQEIVLSDSVTCIGDFAFDGCIELNRINIPKGVRSIGAYTFSGCRSLTKVIIPKEVVSIGVFAFTGCTNLFQVEMPNSVMSIGGGAFTNCSNLAQIVIPKSVTSIGRNIFGTEAPNNHLRCKNLVEIYTESKYVVNELIKQSVTIQQLSSSLIKEDISKFKGEDCKIMCMAHLNNMKDDIPGEVLKIINGNAKGYLIEIINGNDISIINRALDVVTLKLATVTACMEAAKELGATEVDALLLEKNKVFSIEDKQKEAKKRLNKNPFAIEEMKKLWEYRRNREGNITIISYKGSAENVTIPHVIGRTPVMYIYQTAFIRSSNLVSIYIPNSINELPDLIFNKEVKIIREKTAVLR